LKKEIGNEHYIERALSKLGGLRFFEIGPNDRDIFKSPLVRLGMNTTQKVTLHIYRIHVARILEPLGNGEYVRAASRTEIRNRHARFDTECSDIARRMRESWRCVRFVMLCSLLHQYNYIASSAPSGAPQRYTVGIENLFSGCIRLENYE